MSNMPPFEGFDLSGLVLAHNELARELREKFGIAADDRKSFKNKSSGVEACKALWAKIPTKGQPKESVNMSEDTSVTTEGAEAVAAPETTTKKPRAKKAAPASGKAKKAAPKKEGKAKTAPAKKAAPAKKTAAPKEKNADGRTGRATKYSDKDRITVLAEGNPKRPGSAQAEMWDGYKGNPSVGKFKERLLAMGYDEKAARTRLMYDVARGLVGVTTA